MPNAMEPTHARRHWLETQAAAAVELALSAPPAEAWELEMHCWIFPSLCGEGSVTRDQALARAANALRLAAALHLEEVQR